ncbi:hypothetical protein ACET3Z_014378 [Daucus carota]
MEANGTGGGMFSGINSVMLGLQLAPQHHQLHENIVSFGQPQVDQQAKNQQSSRTLHLTISDDDDDDDDEPGLESVGKSHVSPWQRMKWTDTMVKLLIMVVFYMVEDQAVSEGNDVAGKKGVNGSGALQKKGKWKSVSKAMMERGFFVSPQQCEDKFNDLNKRFKRVNDILGKGTSCKVVEDQSLLQRMDHLSPEIKEEVRKLLNSKHLFFREMCAYHSGCGGSAQHSAEVVGESSQIHRKKKCLHSSENSPNVPHLGRVETEDSKIIKIGSDEEDDDDEEEEDDEDDEVEDGARGHDKESDPRTSHKRRRNEMYSSPSVQEFNDEVNYIVQNETKSSGEKKQWMRIRLMHLEEQRIRYQREAYELEKKKMKWMKFSGRKDRYMEAEKLANEKMRLENEKMVLVIKQTEVDHLDFQQQSIACNRRDDSLQSLDSR